MLFINRERGGDFQDQRHFGGFIDLRVETKY